ncbi:hypothetical protein JTB14_003255 [Gonioctena quinquepunctata]|nr:hypothetical protein JTB14_003255 [Gonioctena quinquepunctata]
MDFNEIISTDQLEKVKAKIDYYKKNEMDGKCFEFFEEKAEISENKKMLFTKGMNGRYGRNYDDDKDEINEMKYECDDKYKGYIDELLNKHNESIMYESRVAKEYVHKIEVKETEKFKSKNYPIPYKYREQVKEESEKMVKQGIIERSNSNYINPIVVVVKKEW